MPASEEDEGIAFKRLEALSEFECFQIEPMVAGMIKQVAEPATKVFQESGGFAARLKYFRPSCSERR